MTPPHRTVKPKKLINCRFGIQLAKRSIIVSIQYTTEGLKVRFFFLIRHPFELIKTLKFHKSSSSFDFKRINTYISSRCMFG
jgi:hypothetical protein